MVVRKQSLSREGARRVEALNWTISGVPITDGTIVTGSPRLCSKCGSDLPPYAQESCPECNSNF